MVAYVHTLMFGVDRNFRSITKPRIRLNIVGIIVVKVILVLIVLKLISMEHKLA